MRDTTSESIFANFTNLYPVSKTLRFKLIPQGKTQEWIDKKGLLATDEQLTKDAKIVKKYIDDFHRSFIVKALASLQLDGWDELESAICSNNKNYELIRSLQAELRKKMRSGFEKFEEFKNLTELKTLFKTTLPEWMQSHGYAEEQIELVKQFNGKAGYFDKFNTTRENMYVEEAKATSIANRAVNDNFSRFALNKQALDLIQSSSPDFWASVKNLAITSDYNQCLSPDGITNYNEQIGKINSELNEAYQKKLLGRRYRLQPLYKQILCEGESSFAIPKQFNSDNELVKNINEFSIDVLLAKNADFEKSPEFISNLIQENFDGGIVVKRSNLGTLSKILFGQGNTIYDSISYCAVNKLGPAEQNSRLSKAWEDAKAATYLLNEIIAACVVARQEHIAADLVATKVGNCLASDWESVNQHYKAYLKISSKYGKATVEAEAKKLLGNDRDIQIVNEYFNAVKQFQKDLSVFEISLEDAESAVFYGSYIDYLEPLYDFDALYNSTRNYLTQKPFSSKKFKLNFESGQLGNGWDLNKEKDCLCVLFKRGNHYYLGVMNKNARPDFVISPSSSNEDSFQKMIYKMIPSPSKMLPKVSISSKEGRNKFPISKDFESKYKKGLHKPGAAFNLEYCRELIDYFKLVLLKYPGWDVFNFDFAPTETYQSLNDFYADVNRQNRYLSFVDIAASDIDSLVDQGKLYLFEIYCKDFSQGSTGKKNLHTYYWELIFSKENAEHGYPFWLNGNAELFYRPRTHSLSSKATHERGSVLLNKTYTENGVVKTIPNKIYTELCAVANHRKQLSDLQADLQEDATRLWKSGLLEMHEATKPLVKDRRYTVDQYELHVPITINAAASSEFASREKSFNSEVLRQIKDSKEARILGIDRGEKNLLYLTLIDKQGNILLQQSLNCVTTANNAAVDYREKLSSREKEQQAARRSWKSVGKIADLKDGYLSQAIHEIIDIAVKNNAIIVMEDLNSPVFKHCSFNTQAYKKFETQLINKLSYLAEKPENEEAIWRLGNIARGYQLAPKPGKQLSVGKQKGFIFYIPPWKTSKIDPTTGFMNLFRFNSDTIDFWRDFFGRMDAIRFNSENHYFEFAFRYSNFKAAIKDEHQWCVCSSGEERPYQRKNRSTGFWETEYINVTQGIEELFESEGIPYKDGSDLKKKIASMNRIKSLGFLFKRLVDLRYADNSQADYAQADFILSPVKNRDGCFFDSRNASEDLPKDGDANGAYHIALKGLQALENIEEQRDGTLVLAKQKNPKEAWNSWIQARCN